MKLEINASLEDDSDLSTSELEQRLTALFLVYFVVNLIAEGVLRVRIFSF